MATLTSEAVIKRIDELLATTIHGDVEGYEAVNQVLHGTLAVLATVHGAGSQQQATLLQVVDAAHSKPTSLFYNFAKYVYPATRGVLQALKADVQGGFIGNIHRRAVGEVVGDMLGLAKEALVDGSDAAKNVAAVLAAAAYEDTIRRMGGAFAKVQGRPKLEDVVTALKDASVIQGSEVTIVLGHLNFRNNALHADWSKVNDTAVKSCIGVVEHLLLKHFS